MVRGVEHRLNTKVRRIDCAAQRMELSDGGGPAPFSEVPWLWTDQFDMNMQVAGAPAACDELVYRGDPTKGGFLAFQLLNKAVVGAISVEAKTGKGLGAPITCDVKTFPVRIQGSEIQVNVA
jgi:hypothetical protein